jgi:hypothetical protein
VTLKIAECDGGLRPPIDSADRYLACREKKTLINGHVGGAVLEEVILAKKRHGIEESH